MTTNVLTRQIAGQISFEDFFGTEKKEEKKDETLDLVYGDFEYLKYLKQKDIPKLIKLNIVKSDGVKNLLKVERFLKALQKQAVESSGEKLTLDLEEHKEAFRTIFYYVSGWDNDFEKPWSEKIVENMVDIAPEAIMSAFNFTKDSNVVCVKLTGKFETGKTNSVIIMVDLDNTFPKKYAFNSVFFRRPDEFYDCRIFTMNYSVLQIIKGFVELFNNLFGTEDALINEGKSRAFGKLFYLFKYPKRFYYDDYVLELYYKKTIVEYEKYLNIVNNIRMSNEDKKVYAKAFQTKKNIQKQTLAVMENNSFLKNFSYVELDDTVDLVKFNELSKYFLEYRKMLPYLLPNKEDKVSFRVRRLGNYRAAGIYFPLFDTVAVDVNGVFSFVHECGHWLDHKKLNDVSMSDDFISKISLPFKEDFQERNKLAKTYAISSTYYWCSSREVFARAFEVYIKNKHFKDISCPFLATDEFYRENVAYSWLTENIEVVNDFFDSLDFEF